MESPIELSNTLNTQVLITTHTPTLAGLLPTNSLRLITNDAGIRNVEPASEDVLQRIVDTLGLLPDPISKNARAILLVEGKSDVTFINHTSQKLKEANHITHTFDEKNFAIVPIGGCGNLKHWRTLKLAEQFNIPWCILIDSDLGTPEEVKNTIAINNLKADGIKAYVTRKREPENYIDLAVLALPAGSMFTFIDTDDAKVLIGLEKTIRKDNVLDTFWPSMTTEQIRNKETYLDEGITRFEFTEMFADFLTLTP
ncbi:MAG: hypothetical protein H0W73_16360 [Bacteroidetes bacterium]|nr:hypothetical protein [Bacteroidota bacterium]